MSWTSRKVARPQQKLSQERFADSAVDRAGHAPELGAGPAAAEPGRLGALLRAIHNDPVAVLKALKADRREGHAVA